MPFDGSKYFVKPSMFSRVKYFLFKEPEKPVPIQEHPLISDAKQLLVTSRRLIEHKRDWFQGAYQAPDGRMCAVGALRKASKLLEGTNTVGHVGSLRSNSDSQFLARKAMLVVSITHGFDTIESMNDHSSHRFVIKAFDQAIAKLEKSEIENKWQWIF